MSHSATRYRSTLFGMGRIYKSCLKSNSIHTFYEGQIQNGVPHGFGRLISHNGE